MIELFDQPIANIQDLSAVALPEKSGNPFTYLLPLMSALVISMVLIPIMVRLAPRVGMVDKPEARKVHAEPVPRVGGIGIVLGSLIPISLLLPIDAAHATFINVIGTRSTAQRQEIRQIYKTMHGRDLLRDIDSVSSGTFQRVVCAGNSSTDIDGVHVEFGRNT